MINIQFRNLDNKKISAKRLGQFWKEGRDFYIVIDINQSNKSKIYTLIEESLHLMFRFLVCITGKSISAQKEHRIIAQIFDIIKKENIFNGECLNGSKTSSVK